MTNKEEAIEILVNAKLQLVATEIYLLKLQKLVNSSLTNIKRQDIQVNRGLLRLKATPDEIVRATLSQETLERFDFVRRNVI